MKNKVVLFALLGAVAVLASCSSRNTEKMIVASETRQCYGVGVMQCMLVKTADADTWEFFYGGIDGFDYEPGYEYVLKVKKETVANPPQDASSIKYTLVKVVSKEQKTSDDLPPNIGQLDEFDYQ